MKLAIHGGMAALDKFIPYGKQYIDEHSAIEEKYSQKNIMKHFQM